MSRSSKSTPTNQDSVYQQIVNANQLSTEISEAETDILDPEFRYSRFQPGESSELIVDEDTGRKHRIDNRHATIPPSHLSMRLQKFVELAQRYAAESETQDIQEPESDSFTPGAASPKPVKQELESSSKVADLELPNQEITFRARADWETTTRRKFVGTDLTHANTAPPTIKPLGESSIGPGVSRTRIDARHAIEAPHFKLESIDSLEDSQIATDSRPEKAVVQSAHQGLLWQAEEFAWPLITTQLLEDPSRIIDQIGNNLIKLLTGDQNQLAVSATRKGEGTTTLAISLARWARNQGKQVLLIDADLNDGDLSSSIGLDASVSWLSAINDQRKIGQAIVQEQDTGIFVMPVAPLVDRSNLPSNIYQALGKLLESISDCFDLIVMDIGTTRHFLDETSRIDLVADAALLIQDPGITNAAEFVESRSSVLAAGIAKMIVAQNTTGVNLTP